MQNRIFNSEADFPPRDDAALQRYTFVYEVEGRPAPEDDLAYETFRFPDDAAAIEGARVEILRDLRLVTNGYMPPRKSTLRVSVHTHISELGVWTLKPGAEEPTWSATALLPA